jgi:hypothetical protein
MACKPSDSSRQVAIVQLPARDSATARALPEPTPQSFSTKTYKRKQA